MSDAQHPEIVDTNLPSTNYKVREAYAGVWYVEFTWHVPAVDSIFTAIFMGPEAGNRAREYADWKNRS